MKSVSLTSAPPSQLNTVSSTFVPGRYCRLALKSLAGETLK